MGRLHFPQLTLWSETEWALPHSCVSVSSSVYGVKKEAQDSFLTLFCSNKCALHFCLLALFLLSVLSNANVDVCYVSLISSSILLHVFLYIMKQWQYLITRNSFCLFVFICSWLAFLSVLLMLMHVDSSVDLFQVSWIWVLEKRKVFFWTFTKPLI